MFCCFFCEKCSFSSCVIVLWVKTKVFLKFRAVFSVKNMELPLVLYFVKKIDCPSVCFAVVTKNAFPIVYLILGEKTLVFSMI